MYAGHIFDSSRAVFRFFSPMFRNSTCCVCLSLIYVIQFSLLTPEGPSDPSHCDYGIVCCHQEWFSGAGFSQECFLSACVSC